MANFKDVKGYARHKRYVRGERKARYKISKKLGRSAGSYGFEDVRRINRIDW